VASEHPYAHNRYRKRKAEELRGCEATAESEGESLSICAWPDDVLAHGQQQKGQRHGGYNCGERFKII